MGKDGVIVIPSVAHGKATGSGVPMKTVGKLGGMQLLGSKGFKAPYEFDAPEGGKYKLTAKVVTVQEEKKFAFGVNGASAVEVPVPYTKGLWAETAPIEVALNKGKNTLVFEITSNGIAGKQAIKEFILTPVK